MSDYPKLDPEETRSFIKQVMADWIPFPSRAYCEKVGWTVNPDGTVDTPGGPRIPTRELCEVTGLEKLL